MFSIKYHKSIDDVFENDPSLIFWNSQLAIYLFLKSGPVTILNDEYLKILVFVEIVAFKQIGTVAHVHEARL
jgi:hypothetical protein